MIPIAAVASSAVDATPDPRLHRAAQEFESMLLSELLKMGGEDSLSDSSLDQTCMQGFDDLRNQAVATALAQHGGIGIARMLERQLSPAADIKAFSSSADT